MEQDGDAVSGSKPAKVLDSLAKAPAAKDEAGTVPAPEKEIEQTTPSQVGLPAVAQQKDPNASDKHIACETEQKSQRLKRKTVICDDDDEEEASDEADADVEMEATDAKDADADTDVQEGAGTKKAMKLKQAPTTGAKAAKAAPSKGVSLSAYSSYDPIAAATWQAGKPMPYSFLANIFSEIEDQSKRLRITEMLANGFRTVIAVSPAELLPVVSLTTNKIGAAYEGLELGIGDSVMIKAVAETCGRSVEAIKAQLEEVGDLGIVALSSRSRQVTLGKPKPLTVGGVYQVLRELASMSGKDVQTRKKDKIKHMLVAAQGKEAQYIIRALQGKMRIGLAEQTVLVALAHAVLLTDPNAASAETPKPALPSGDALHEMLAAAEVKLKRVFCEMPNYEVIISALIAHGLEDLHKHAHLTAGVPVKPMLAKPTKGVSEVLDRFCNGRFTCEFKYDGERAQIHMKPNGEVCVFSRNSEDMTSKYPDIAAMIPRAVGEVVESFILDTEAVAMDRQTGEIKPFQVLSTRKRKDASVDNISVQVCVFAFDLLFLNGESLLQQPLLLRREKLKASFNVIDREFDFARGSDVADEDGITEWLHAAVKGNCEGLMVKTLETDATYEPSRRSLNWLKIKKDYLQGMTDSCDLVPIGAYYGKGKRAGVYGAYLLACYNEEDEEYQSVCKLGTGFSDEALATHTETLNKHRLDAPRPYYRVPETSALTCDVWFEPCQVWEVLAADLSISPVHMAAVGLVDGAKGIALRFPRFLRVREDKGPEDATNAKQIAQMYSEQSCTKGNTGAVDDDDYF
uniref:DNA ligase n=1 Tax=Chrysotila carterae TaxID=13221 RepID=A0A7S4FBN9_CHRCT